MIAPSEIGFACSIYLTMEFPHAAGFKNLSPLSIINIEKVFILIDLPQFTEFTT